MKLFETLIFKVCILFSKNVLKFLSALFIILVDLMMTLFSDKMLIFHKMHMWFDAQLDQKSCMDSNKHTPIPTSGQKISKHDN